MDSFKLFVEGDDDYWTKRMAQFQAAAAGQKGAITDIGTPSGATRPKATIRDTLSDDDIRQLEDGLKLGSAVPPNLIDKLQLRGAKRSLVGDVSTMSDRGGISQVRAAYPFLNYGRTIRFSVGFRIDQLLRLLQ